MWNISVAPMPSIISMPVASFHSWRVASGSASPADTHLRRLTHVVLLGARRHLRGRRSAR